MVNKDVLKQYIDLKEEIKEVQSRIQKTEKQIERIKKEGAVVDKVKGGSGGIQSYRIEGFPIPEYSRKKTLLYTRKAILTELELEIAETLNSVEEFVSGIKDSHIRRIVTLRVVEGLSWNDVAKKIGGGNTEGSVKMAYQRFMEKS